MSIAIKDLLLIEEPTVLILKDELMRVASWFILPSFAFALCMEFFGDLKFGEVVKKLILIIAFTGCFYSFHKAAVEVSFLGSEEILKKVSPRNVFLKNWTEVKVRTKANENWSMFEKFAIPNVNDLLGNFFFVLSKLFIWILKLVYTTVYHLTYVFAPITAVLYFFPVTRSSLGGTIQSSLWCIFMPFVLVSLLAIVGNSIQAPAANGELSIITIDQIIWLFGVTFLLLMSPVLTLGLLRGGGVAMSGSAIGTMVTSSAFKLLKASPVAAKELISNTKKAGALGAKTILEPSIREMLRSEMKPDQNKMKILDKKGGVKNPLKKSASLDERLSKVGIDKGEAISLTKIPSTKVNFSSGNFGSNNSEAILKSKASPTYKELSKPTVQSNERSTRIKAEMSNKSDVKQMAVGDGKRISADNNSRNVWTTSRSSRPNISSPEESSKIKFRSLGNKNINKGKINEI